MTDKLIQLDDRRRVGLAKVGRKEDTVYLVTEYSDGTIVLTPADIIPKFPASERPAMPWQDR